MRKHFRGGFLGVPKNPQDFRGVFSRGPQKCASILGVVFLGSPKIRRILGVVFFGVPEKPRGFLGCFYYYSQNIGENKTKKSRQGSFCIYMYLYVFIQILISRAVNTFPLQCVYKSRAGKHFVFSDLFAVIHVKYLSRPVCLHKL